jgi:hypothetical protein
MKAEKDITQTVRISKASVKTVKRILIEEGGTIRSFIEESIELKASQKKKKP